MRDRLIELLKQADDECAEYICEHENAADRIPWYDFFVKILLDNGVVVLPCKVGDTVYYFSSRPFNMSLLPNTIYEAHVVRMVITRFGIDFVIQIHNERGVTEVPHIDSFGKTVFLTREEAEQALKGGDGK